MNNGRFCLASASAIAALVGLSGMVGCSTSGEESLGDNMAAIRACQLDDGTVDPHDDLRACDPQDKKKTTICHIPPGNPANAHTLCVGNAAVPAHLGNHGDHLGPCVTETRCPPAPPAPPTGGGGANGPAGGSGGATVGTGGATGGGTGGAPFIIE